MVSPGNKQTDKVILRIMFVYMCMHVTTINQKENKNLKGAKTEYM